jgi:hypothetical protein
MAERRQLIRPQHAAQIDETVTPCCKASLFEVPNPHSLRKTLAQLGERLCRTQEEFKAWSQNLGHEQVLTTFSSYGQVAADRQAELIRRLGQRQWTSAPKAELIHRVIQVLQDGKHDFE